MKYKCSKCNKEFLKKGDFSRHLKRKNPCKKSEPNCANTEPKEPLKKVSNDTKLYIYQEPTKSQNNKCIYCNKIFAYKNSLVKHMNNRCKIKNKMDIQKEAIFNELLRKIDNLEQSNRELHKKLAKITCRSVNTAFNNNSNYNTQNNAVNGNVNTFVSVGCGKEDIGRIDKTEILQAIKAGFHAPIRLTDTVHFNPKYPEYHNVYISNMKDKFETAFYTREDLKWYNPLKIFMVGHNQFHVNY